MSFNHSWLKSISFLACQRENSCDSHWYRMDLLFCLPQSLLWFGWQGKTLLTIKNQHHNKSPGPGGLIPAMYKYLVYILVDPLVIAINESTQLNVLLTSQAKVVLIWKSGKDHLLPQSYRPVLLLNQDAKIRTSITFVKFISIHVLPICLDMTASVVHCLDYWTKETEVQFPI